MKGIVLAAGRGERLRPLTDSIPKCMVEYEGKPLLQHVTDAFLMYDIPVTVVRGYRKENVVIGDHFIDNDDYLNTTMVDSLFCALDDDSDDIIVSYSDIVYDPKYIGMLMGSKGLSVIADRNWRPYWEQRQVNPLDDAETFKVRNGLIVEIGKKPFCYEEIEGQYIGLFKISKDLLSKVMKMKKTKASSITEFIQELIDNDVSVHPVWVEGGWMEFDTLSDLKIKKR